MKYNINSIKAGQSCSALKIKAKKLCEKTYEYVVVLAGCCIGKMWPPRICNGIKFAGALRDILTAAPPLSPSISTPYIRYR